MNKQKLTNEKDFWKDMLNLKNDRLIAIVAIDEEKFFTLVYSFERDKEIFNLRLKLDKKKPIIRSIHLLFPSAIYYECEIHDFFGIEFEDNNRLHDKLFLPDDFTGKPPLLR